MLNTLNLGLKSSLLMATVVSGAIVTTSAYFLGEYQYFNTVANQINNYMSPVVALFPKAYTGFNSLTSKSVDWSKKAALTTKEYAVSLATKAIDSDTWKTGTTSLAKSAHNTIQQQLNADSIFELFDKEKILSIISDIHGNIIPNLSKVLSSLSSLVSSLIKGTVSLNLMKDFLGEALKGKTVDEALKEKIQEMLKTLVETVRSLSDESKKSQLKSKAESLISGLGQEAKALVNKLIEALTSSTKEK